MSKRLCMAGFRILGVAALIAAGVGGVMGGSRQAPDPIGGTRVAMKSSGALDPSFSGDGAVVRFISSGSRPPFEVSDEATAVAVDASGRIVVAGHGTDWPLAVVRYNSDGTADGGFGSSGFVGINPGALTGAAHGMILQPDGRILVAGSAGRPLVFTVARLNADGSLDATFGTGGIAHNDLASDAVAYAVALQPDGRIVLAGTVSLANGQGTCLMRFNADGSLDTSFGSGGVTIESHSGVGIGAAMALQADGGIVVAGGSFVVARFTETGALDAGFGAGGYADLTAGFDGSEARAVVVQPDGKIVVGGSQQGSRPAFAVARLNPDGSPDAEFGHSGVVTTEFRSDAGGTALVLQPDGRLVVAGWAGESQHPAGAGRYFALVRYETTGALDRSFGKSGRATADVSGAVTGAAGGNDGALALALQPDGRLIAAGSSLLVTEVDSRRAFAVARFLP